MKKTLKDVTLLGLDCINLDRLVLAADICRQNFDFAEVKLLTSLPPHGCEHTIKIEPILSIERYSNFLISQIHRYIETSHVLVIQYDGFILNPSAWRDTFLEYDYIGAPWYHLGPNLRVGNGGFSLRSKKLMELAAHRFSEQKTDYCHPEDVWICHDTRPFLESNGIHFAPETIAKHFSFEADLRHRKWNGQFGFHGGVWRTNISKWLVHNRAYKQNWLARSISKR